MPAAKPKTVQVLWIGNSYTGVNNLPAVVEAMVNADGSGARMEAHRSISRTKARAPSASARR